MYTDQENYDTFEYDKSDSEEMYEPISDTIVVPQTNAPPLPPARNKFKQDVRKKPLVLPKSAKLVNAKLELKSRSLPRMNQSNKPMVQIPTQPQIPDCDENYEEFPREEIKIPDCDENYEEFICGEIKIPDCDENYEEFTCGEITNPDCDENYEEFPREEIKIKSTLISKVSTTDFACNPSLTELLSARSNLKSSTDPRRFSIATEFPCQSEPYFKLPDLIKPKEKPQPSPKSSFITDLSQKMKNFNVTANDSSPTVNHKKSINFDKTNKVAMRSSVGIQPFPQQRLQQQLQQQQLQQQKQQQQQQQQQQEKPIEEDLKDVYADACDARLFLQNKPWYFGKLSRKTEESLLRDINQNGAFLVRDSSQLSVTHPFTLAVFSNNHFHRLKIRHLESGKFVVGEKKESEIEFNTIQDLITYYQTEPLLLMASAKSTNSCTTLKYIPEKSKQPAQ